LKDELVRNLKTIARQIIGFDWNSIPNPNKWITSGLRSSRGVVIRSQKTTRGVTRVENGEENSISGDRVRNNNAIKNPICAQRRKDEKRAKHAYT